MVDEDSGEGLLSGGGQPGQEQAGDSSLPSTEKVVFTKVSVTFKTRLNWQILFVLGLSTNRPEPNRFELSLGFWKVRLGSVQKIGNFIYCGVRISSNWFKLVWVFERFDSVRLGNFPVRDTPTFCTNNTYSRGCFTLIRE